ncbi:hypothetical protein [Butyrivibrio sp. INlla21]|uniref:hypothetical protein n=1 Tax=Butyrivibrio sp. INlla21 TaxID=1520811 RepID=UPI0008EE6B9F|nr:hypothetical protein [Butyrivibrio sp. INlla21]SFU36701.1 hypothetical protein SAMN02910342_00269 [Butyrivibrio sp. INlla21]
MGKALIMPLTVADGISLSYAREFAKANGNRRVTPYEATKVLYGRRNKRKEGEALRVLWACVSFDMATYDSHAKEFIVYG